MNLRFLMKREGNFKSSLNDFFKCDVVHSCQILSNQLIQFLHVFDIKQLITNICVKGELNQSKHFFTCH